MNVKMLGGPYRISIEEGVLLETPWANVYAMINYHGEVLAFFAETANWLTFLPKVMSQRLARLPEEYDVLTQSPTYSIEGIPLLRSRKPLQAGATARARIPFYQEAQHGND